MDIFGIKDWEHQEVSVELDDDLFIEIYAETESDLLDQLAYYSMADLKAIARCASRQINNKLHGHKLIGDNYMKKTNSLDCCAKTPAPVAVASIPAHPWNALNIPNSMESDMNYNTTTTLEADTRKYLLNRLERLEGAKYGEAEAKYLPVTENPKTGKALKDALDGGWLKVTVRDDDKIGTWDNWYHYVELQDPSKPRDRDAFEKATGLIAKGKTEAKDAIMVLTQADGLAALKAFEGTTYH